MLEAQNTLVSILNPTVLTLARPENVLRTLSILFRVARVRRLYVLHHDAQKSCCHTCMCVSVLYESVQKSPFHPLI